MQTLTSPPISVLMYHQVGVFARPAAHRAVFCHVKRFRAQMAYLKWMNIPVLSLEPDQVSQYTLRRSCRNDHFCTSEVAALCMNLAGEHLAGDTLEAYLAIFTHHYLRARNQLPIEWDSAAHRRLREVSVAMPLHAIA